MKNNFLLSNDQIIKWYHDPDPDGNLTKSKNWQLDLLKTH